jgi:quercetin dioxygenase-like cupin family protein
MSNLQAVSKPRIAFSAFDPDMADHNGMIQDLNGNLLRTFPHAARYELEPGYTHFGYVQEGNCFLYIDQAVLEIIPGYYFSVPGGVEIYQPRGKISSGLPNCVHAGLIISRRGYEGFVHIGKIEEQGRLRYIDGCTDSLLIPPIKLGDPCLNLLYFPPAIDQTMHTHPSERIGMILSGYGVCITPQSETALVPGMLFCIHPDGKHKFRTHDSSMRVLAYHPDSDFGPTDQDHPMINRTMVEGVSARDIPAIHTA